MEKLFKKIRKEAKKTNQSTLLFSVKRVEGYYSGMVDMMANGDEIEVCLKLMLLSEPELKSALLSVSREILENDLAAFFKNTKINQKPIHK